MTEKNNYLIRTTSEVSALLQKQAETESFQTDVRRFLDTLADDSPEAIIATSLKFREMMMVYNSAIKEVHTKLEILNDELTILQGKNTIESITSRIKKPASILAKLKRQGKPLSLDAIRNEIDDVAGVRVICSFIDDIYDVADMLIRQDDVRLLKCKDYIKNPKSNGYRSLHLLIEVPVFFSNDKQMLKVEIQIRTIAMNFWASLEHQLRYKKQIGDVETIGDELRECSDIIAGVDSRMLRIRDMLQDQEDDEVD